MIVNSYKNCESIEVVYLSYVGKSYEKPKAKLLRTYTASYADIKSECAKRRFKDDICGRFSCKQFSWYIRGLYSQLAKTSKRLLRIAQWHITFSDKRAFVINGKFYREISFMVGPKNIQMFYGNPLDMMDISLSTEKNKIELSSKSIIEGFIDLQRHNSKKCSSHFLAECATSCLYSKDCSLEFVMMCIGAKRMKKERYDDSTKRVSNFY